MVLARPPSGGAAVETSGFAVAGDDQQGFAGRLGVPDQRVAGPAVEIDPVSRDEM